MDSMKLQKYFFGFLILVLSVLAVACGSSKLSGAWVPESGGSAPYRYPDNVEFFSDGTCEIEGYNGEYSIDDGRLKLTVDVGVSQAVTYEYELRNDTLVLTRDGQSVTYIRKD